MLLTLAAALAALLLGIVGVGQAQTAASLIEVQVHDVGRSGRGTGHRMKQGAGRRLAVLVLAFLAVILVAAPPEHRAEAQGPNTPATGAVTVTGTARVGETLTADASSIADADGLSDRNFILVWMAGATSDPAEATRRIFSNGERYHVDPRDAGLMVMVAARFLDDAGNLEEVVSAPTAVVAPTAPGPPVNLAASSKPHGNLSVSWLAPFWRLEDWLADRPSLGDGGSDITGYTVQWKLSTGSWTVPADVSEETVPADVYEGTTTEETHTITNFTGGQTYTLRVIATNAVGDSQPSGEITRAINRFPTGTPTLTGTPRVGEVLTIGTSGITDGDGLTNPGFSYAWLVEPEPPNVILSRLYSQPNWLVRPVDVGRTIQAVVFFGDDAGFNETLRSTPTTVVAPSSPDPPRNLRASPGGGGALNLEWEAPTWSLGAWLNGATDIGDGGSPITGYTVQWRKAAGDWANPSDVSQAVVTGRTSHTIPDLTNGVPYAIRVIATTAIGNSEPSAEVEATPSLAPPPPIILPPIGGGGGGGGGGSSGPTPSDKDFEWSITRDIEELDPGHGSPSGLWSDSTTLWILENGAGADDAVYAYDLASGERVEGREFELDGTNRAPRGVWSDRTTVWVSDSGQNQLFAHDLATGERLPERDIALAQRNRDARGIWSDDETMWVLDGRKDSLFAYDPASGELAAEYALDDANDDPRGLFFDGVTFWVSDHVEKRLFAYRLEAGEDGEGELKRNRDEEFPNTVLSRARNNSPRGIWSDGDVMYVADESDARVYTYNMPAAIDARLASLALSGVDIGEFDPGRPDYEAVVADGVTETTVEAEAAQDDAVVDIVPADADGEADGYQVALQDLGEITVTVTSADGSRKRTYRVRLSPEEAAGPAPDCLRGDVAVGFSLVVYAGGSIDDLAACAESRNATALYALDGGEYVSYILGAPEFVNDDFRALFAEGLPSLTPLTVRSDGPATAAPVASVLTQPGATCLRGEIVEGFNLVLYEGGGVDELEACGVEVGLAALYVLDDGVWVSYILGAPEFVNLEFRELFADGLPVATPLVGKRD